MIKRTLHSLFKVAWQLKLSWRGITHRKLTGAQVMVWYGHSLLLITNSYRRGLYLPGGGIGRREPPANAAIRELREETGIEVAQRDLSDLGTVNYEIKGVAVRDHLFAVNLHRFSASESRRSRGHQCLLFSDGSRPKHSATEPPSPFHASGGRGVTRAVIKSDREIFSNRMRWSGLHTAAIGRLKTNVRGYMETRSPRALLRYRILRNIGYEPEMALLPKLCDPGKISLDIGANIGIYTWHLAKYSSKVLAFEPNPALAIVLRATFEPGVEIHELALSNIRAVANLSFPGQNHALGRIALDGDHGPRGDSDMQSFFR